MNQPRDFHAFIENKRRPQRAQRPNHGAAAGRRPTGPRNCRLRHRTAARFLLEPADRPLSVARRELGRGLAARVL